LGGRHLGWLSCIPGSPISHVHLRHGFEGQCAAGSLRLTVSPSQDLDTHKRLNWLLHLTTLPSEVRPTPVAYHQAPHFPPLVEPHGSEQGGNVETTSSLTSPIPRTA